jgi:CheY-like chemotaxis protein
MRKEPIPKIDLMLDAGNNLERNNICSGDGEKSPVILVVDDNPVQALTRKAILAGAGLQAETAYSADAAFSALKDDLARDISLVITDHIMPGESGSVFVKRLWKTRPGLPIMVLSGLAEAEDDYAGLDVTFRAKPIRPADLIDLARQLSEPNSMTA